MDWQLPYLAVDLLSIAQERWKVIDSKIEGEKSINRSNIYKSVESRA